MAGAIERNVVVQHFGTPDVTEGSVNEPRITDEFGMRFNEKWVYQHPHRDPACAAARMILWQRYDYVGSLIRPTPGADWQQDNSLPNAFNA